MGTPWVTLLKSWSIIFFPLSNVLQGSLVGVWLLCPVCNVRCTVDTVASSASSCGDEYRITISDISVQYQYSEVQYILIYIYRIYLSIYVYIYIICMYVSFIWSILKLWTKAMTLPLATGRLWRPALLDFRCVILVATFGESQADQEAQGLSRMVFDSDGMVVVVASRKQAISRISGASRCGGLCKAEE